MAVHTTNIANETGAFGTTFINDTATHTPTSPHTQWFRIVPLTTTTLAATGNTAGGVDGNAIANMVITVGSWADLPGLTSIKLASGTCLAYYLL